MALSNGTLKVAGVDTGTNGRVLMDPSLVDTIQTQVLTYNTWTDVTALYDSRICEIDKCKGLEVKVKKGSQYYYIGYIGALDAATSIYIKSGTTVCLRAVSTDGSTVAFMPV